MISCNHIFAFFIGTICLLNPNKLFACSCQEKPTLQNAFKHSDIIIKGTVINVDTVQSFDRLIHDRKGVKVGKERLGLRDHFRVRFKIQVNSVFKTVCRLPDTVFILTGFGGSDCGVLFIAGSSFLISGYNKVDKQILSNKTKKSRNKIIETLSGNTFQTSTCSYNRLLTDKVFEEIKSSNK